MEVERIVFETGMDVATATEDVPLVFPDIKSFGIAVPDVSVSPRLAIEKLA